MKGRKISAYGLILPLSAAMFIGALTGCTITFRTHYVLTGTLLAGLALDYFIHRKKGRHPRSYMLCMLLFLTLGLESRSLNSGKEIVQGNGNRIQACAASVNASLCRRIDTLALRYSLNRNYAVQTSSALKALLMGDRSGISGKVARDFRISGTIHLLALSGLHVGIIYVFIINLLFFLPSAGCWRTGKSLLIVSAVWIFTFVTGMGISTVRAAVFISLREIGSISFRSPSGGDILGTTCILMLTANPAFASDLGFQMSFAAVAGIVILVNPIERYYKEIHASLHRKVDDMESLTPGFRRKYLTAIGLVHRVLSNTTVTVVCQLTSGTIALYRFGSYPTFFLLANLLAVPAATVSVFTGMLLLCFGGIPPIGKPVCTVLNLSIGFLEKVAETFA